MKIRALLLSLAITIALVGACTAQVTTLPAETTTITATTTVTTATPTTITTTATETVTTTTTETITTTATTTVTTTTTSTTTPEVESVQLISQSEWGNNQIWYHVRVDYEGLAPREAEIRVNHNPNSKGTVIFISGGWGKSWYSDFGEYKAQTVNKMLDEGYETYEIKWLGEMGWGTDNFGQGPKKLTLAIADVVRWIVIHIANNPDIVGAVGSSCGSNILAYGLTKHGLDDILDVVLLAPGPAWTDLVTLCDIGMPGAKFIVDYCMGWQGDEDYCQGTDKPEWVIQALQEQSIVSSVPGESRDFHYPATKVVFIEGELDEPSMVNAWLFCDTIASEKSWIVLPGVGHGVPNDPGGAATIQEMLLEGLGASN